MSTYTDACYFHFLNQTGVPMLYMMPVLPVSISLLIHSELDIRWNFLLMSIFLQWFYTNLPAYDKNWVWRGDDLWFE